MRRARLTLLCVHVVLGLGLAAACGDTDEPPAPPGVDADTLDVNVPKTEGGAGDATAALDSATGNDATANDAAADAKNDGTVADAGSDVTTDAATDALVSDAGDAGCALPPSGIVGWWTGDDTTNDRTGNHNMTTVGSVPYVAGMVGNGFSFTPGNYLTRPHVAAIALTSAYTIEAWVKVTATGGRIVDHITASIPDGYLLDTYPQNVRAYAGAVFAGGTTTLTLNTWHHLAAVFDGDAIDGGPDGGVGTLKVYRNGVLEGTVTATSPAVTNTKPLRIGADSNGANSLNGIADEVTIYDRPLSEAELKAIFNAGALGKCK